MDFNGFMRDLIAQINFFLYDATVALIEFFTNLGIGG